MCCLACPAAVGPLSAGQSDCVPAIQPPDSMRAAFLAGTACCWWAKEGHTGNVSQRDCTTAWFGARERKRRWTRQSWVLRDGVLPSIHKFKPLVSCQLPEFAQS